MSRTVKSPSFDSIIAFESGELSPRETLRLFSRLVRSGLAWSLQGSYGRTARHLISEGYLKPNGRITPLGRETFA